MLAPIKENFMDLSNIEELLDTFSTFAGAFEDFVTLPVSILNDLLGNEYDVDFDETEGIANGLSS